MKDYLRQSITDSPKAVKLMRKFNLKRVVVGRGHDMGGLIADVCLKNKVLATYHDDGWGGEPEVRFLTDEAEATFRKEFKDNDFAQELFDNGYSFMKDVNKLDFNSLFNAFVEGLELLKSQDKLLKKCKSKLIFGTKFTHNIVSWSKLKDLKDLPTHILQKTYDKYKAELKPNEKFINTDEQLLSLGIKL